MFFFILFFHLSALIEGSAVWLAVKGIGYPPSGLVCLLLTTCASCVCVRERERSLRPATYLAVDAYFVLSFFHLKRAAAVVGEKLGGRAGQDRSERRAGRQLVDWH